MSESDLIIRARQGDELALEALFRQHQEAVFRLAYLILGDGGEADDVAQETFIHAFRALERFDTTRPLRPWLLRITTNQAYNRRRAAGRYVAHLRRLLWITPQSEPGPEREVVQRGQAESLWRAVQRLDRSDQEIIYLRYFLELPVEEAAEALSVAPGTVKSRLHRALGRLRVVVVNEFPHLREEFAFDE